MNARSIIFASLAGMILLVAALLLVGGDDDATAAARPASEAAAGASDPAPAGGETAVLADSLATAPGSGAGAAASGPGGVGSPDASATASPGSSAAPARPAAERSTPAPGAPGQTPAARPSASGGTTGTPSPAAPAASQEGVEDILRATARRYEGIRSLQAEFAQELTNALMGRTTRSAGTLYQRQPDRFLMRFSDPAGDVIVSDGEYFWLYYPSADPKQVIRSSRGAGGLDLRSQFVGDPVRRFEATSHGTETVRGRTTHVLTLTPRERMGYRRLKVWIDAEDHLVRRFELTEDNGNVRRFDLTGVRVNPTLPDSLFRFEPPAGAVVVTR